MIKAKPKKKTYPAYDATKAKGYADRVKALLVERGTINHDISQVCDEAKEDGCEPALIRYAARELMLDDDVRRERDEKRARYLHAVGLAVEAVQSGEMSARQAAKIYSIGKTSIYKEMGVRAVSANREMLAADFELHDADGVVTETQESCGGVESRHAAEAGKARDQRTATGAPGSVGSAVSGDRVSAVGHLQPGDTVPTAGVAPGPHDTSLADRLLGRFQKADEAPAPPSVGAVADASVSEGPRVATPFMGDDPGKPPPFLIRAKQERAA